MAKEDIFKKPLTKEQYEILVKVFKDVFFFSNFIYVIHPIQGKTLFSLYPYQIKVLWYFITKRFNIILKFRQAGITELISMYCLWLAMFHPNKNIVIISIKDRVAKKVLRKIKYMYKNLPDFMKVDIVNGRTGEFGTSTEIEFSNGSMITSIPTTEDAGRSEAVSLLVIDEAAIVRWANQIWAAAFPTLSTGGSSIVNSTPYGIGNWYHKQWVDACVAGGTFNPIRLHWRMHPERDQKWYDEMRESLGARRTAQEIDGDFLTSGNSVFDLVQIKGIEDMLSEYIIHETRFNGALRIFSQPEEGESYFIGGDVSTGRSRDYSAFSIMDRYGEEMACFKGKMPTNQFSALMMEMGYKYNTALLAPESNDIGLAVVSDIQNANYPNLYYSQKILKKKKAKKPEVEVIPGWYTTSKNRPVIIDQLEEDLRKEEVEIKDPFFVQEAYTFIYDESNRPVALGKNKRTTVGDEGGLEDETYTDDSIMAKAITNYIRKGNAFKSVRPPK